MVAESIPQEDTAQAARIFVEGEDASSKGAEEINSLANTEVSPIWKVGGCVVWNQVAKETQAIYEITEIGDDDWATICAIARSGYASGTLARTPFGRIACRFPLPDQKLLQCRVPLWQLAKKWEEFVEKSASEGGFSPTIDQALKLVSSRSSPNSTVANNQQVWDTEPTANAPNRADTEIEENDVSDDGEAQKCPERSNTRLRTSTFPEKTIPKTKSYTSVNAELAQKQKELLGTSWNGSQVLPDMERNPAPEEVDDRPFTQPYNDTICTEITLGVVSNQVYFSQSQIVLKWRRDRSPPRSRIRDLERCRIVRAARHPQQTENKGRSQTKPTTPPLN